MIKQKQFDNFFFIDNGKAIDLGNTSPKIVSTMGKKKIAIIIERNGINRVSVSSQSLEVIKMKVKRRIENLKKGTKIILGRFIGKDVKGRSIFRDIVGFIN